MNIFQYCREQTDTTITQAAEIMGVSRATIYEWERGDESPPDVTERFRVFLLERAKFQLDNLDPK